MKQKYLFLFIAPFLGLFLAIVYASYQVFFWSYQGPKTTFEVKRGEPFSRINYNLSQKKLISSAKLFHRYTKLTGQLKDLRPGVYEIQRGSTMVMILETLTQGRSVGISITIPEGKNLYEIASMLEAKKICLARDFIALAKSKEMAESYGLNSPTLEGYIFPETYSVEVGTNPRSILDMMVKEFLKQSDQLNLEKSHLTPQEVVTLASIVEKETGASWERPRIAGVFLNRLKQRMRLRSDPTTIYGIYERFDGNLRKKDLLEKTPYNTYKISGLPPGAISNPGLESLKAVLNPEEHDYLYFVSQNDGTHKFSRTYKEHLQAVERFQKRRSARSGKSWRSLKQSSSNSKLKKRIETH